MFRELLFQGKQVFQAADVGHPVATPGGQSVADDLVVPQVHVQRQLIVAALHIECRHITDDALHRPIHIDLGEQQVGVDPAQLSGFLIAIVVRLALDPCRLTALVQWVFL